MIVRDGLRRMCAEQEDVFYYLTVMNENYVQPPLPEGVEEGILRGMYLAARRATGDGPRVQLLGSGAILREVLAGRRPARERLRRRGGRLERRRASPSCGATASRSSAGTGSTRPRSRASRTSRRRSPAATGPFVAATDYMRAFADQIRPFVPRRYVALGTDGFGRSDYRVALRRFFEVDRHHVAVAALKALADEGVVEPRSSSRRSSATRSTPTSSRPGAADARAWSLEPVERAEEEPHEEDERRGRDEPDRGHGAGAEPRDAVAREPEQRGRRPAQHRPAGCSPRCVRVLAPEQDPGRVARLGRAAASASRSSRAGWRSAPPRGSSYPTTPPSDHRSRSLVSSTNPPRPNETAKMPTASHHGAPRRIARAAAATTSRPATSGKRPTGSRSTASPTSVSYRYDCCPSAGLVV